MKDLPVIKRYDPLQVIFSHILVVDILIFVVSAINSASIIRIEDITFFGWQIIIMNIKKMEKQEEWLLLAGTCLQRIQPFRGF